jgi:peroxiredoxin
VDGDPDVLPLDFHPGCASYWCSLRDADWPTLMDDVVVLGVSTDSVFCHQVFADEQNPQFALLSDHDGRVSEAYGVLQEEFEGHPRVAKTTVFVIEPDRSIGYVWSGEGDREWPRPRRAPDGRRRRRPTSNTSD